MSRQWPPDRRMTGRAGALVIGVLLIASVTTACGVVGPPIPPEDVGLAKRLQEQEDRERTEAGARRPPAMETEGAAETPLPSITPMGPH